MKNFKLALSSFVIIVSMVIGAQKAVAQKAYFNSKTSRQVVNQKMLVYTCDMQGLKSKEAATALAAKMKASNGIKNVEVKNFNVNKADFVITINTQKGILVLQNSLLAVGIETVYLDNKPVKTTELSTVVKGMKKKK
jgi:hypothetical protein